MQLWGIFGWEVGIFKGVHLPFLYIHCGGIELFIWLLFNALGSSSSFDYGCFEGTAVTAIKEIGQFFPSFKF